MNPALFDIAVCTAAAVHMLLEFSKDRRDMAVVIITNMAITAGLLALAETEGAGAVTLYAFAGPYLAMAITRLLRAKRLRRGLWNQNGRMGTRSDDYSPKLSGTRWNVWKG